MYVLPHLHGDFGQASWIVGLFIHKSSNRRARNNPVQRGYQVRRVPIHDADEVALTTLVGRHGVLLARLRLELIRKLLRETDNFVFASVMGVHLVCRSSIGGDAILGNNIRHSHNKTFHQCALVVNFGLES